MNRSCKQPVMVRGVKHWRCSRCCANKRPSEFSKSGRNINGLRSECDHCHRLLNREATRQRMRRDRSTNPEKYRTIYRLESRLRDPRSIKIRCRREFGRAIRSGRIVRPCTCSDCGKKCKPHGHHEDYTKPMEVEFLCAVCHGRRHWKE